MLVGEYTHTIDPKNRISLPSKFRREIGKKVVITYGLDHCLFVYPLKQWKEVAERLSQLSMGQADTRSFNRFMLAGAVEIDIDSVGRVHIPDFLKQFASFEKKAVIVGVYNRVEMWEEQAWHEYKSRVSSQADVLAEKLGELGLI